MKSFIFTILLSLFCFSGFHSASAAEATYRFVNYNCYDGVKGTLGGPTSCKQTSLWIQYAGQQCDNHCNASGTKCGVNGYSFNTSCGETPPTTCPEGQLVVGIDPNGNPVCRPAPGCPVGQVVVGVDLNGNSVCRPAPTCPAGTVTQVDASGNSFCAPLPQCNNINWNATISTPKPSSTFINTNGILPIKFPAPCDGSYGVSLWQNGRVIANNGATPVKKDANYSLDFQIPQFLISGEKLVNGPVEIRVEVSPNTGTGIGGVAKTQFYYRVDPTPVSFIRGTLFSPSSYLDSPNTIFTLPEGECVLRADLSFAENNVSSLPVYHYQVKTAELAGPNGPVKRYYFKVIDTHFKYLASQKLFIDSSGEKYAYKAGDVLELEATVFNVIQPSGSVLVANVYYTVINPSGGRSALLPNNLEASRYTFNYDFKKTCR